MAEPTTSDSTSLEPDQEFDVTGEMLAQDYDDEQTIEEEENNDMGEILGNELDELAQDAEIPVDQLFQMYLPRSDTMSVVDTPETGLTTPTTVVTDLSSQQHHDDSNETDGSTDEILNSHNLTLDKDEIAQDLLPNQGENVDEGTGEESIDDLHSDLFPGPGSHASDSPGGSYGTHRLLRSNTATDGDSDTGSEDSDYVPLEDWKKTISVGSDFQAIIPDGLSHYGDAPAYDNEDRLLWDPSKLDVEPVENYLTEVQRPLPGTMGVRLLPLGSHIRDDERSLYMLLQCGHSVTEALRRHRMQLAPPMDEMSLWSEEECRNFESGLRAYGKNFHCIQQNKVRTRSVGELVQFYYLWKKTARHDTFANQARLTKKKYHLHPGITDYMDRFIDDAESLVSPIPSQSLLEKHRINNKISQSVSILSSLNGSSAELLNNSCPEVGGLVAGHLPYGMAASAGSQQENVKRPLTGQLGNEAVKRTKISKDIDNVENNDLVFVDSSGSKHGMNNQAVNEACPIATAGTDVSPPPCLPQQYVLQHHHHVLAAPTVKSIRGNVTVMPSSVRSISSSDSIVRPLLNSNMQAANPIAQ